MKSFSSLETEIWNFVDESGAIVNPTLSFGQYSTGIGLYVVNVGFCKNDWSNKKLSRLFLIYCAIWFTYEQLFELKSYCYFPMIWSVFECGNTSHGDCLSITTMTLPFIIHLPPPSSIISLLVEITVHFFNRVFTYKYWNFEKWISATQILRLIKTWAGGRKFANNNRLIQIVIRRFVFHWLTAWPWTRWTLTVRVSMNLIKVFPKF